MSMYPKYRIDKEKGKFVVRKFTGFDHSWAEYSKPLEIFDTEKEAQEYIGDIILTAQPTQDPKHPTIQEQNPHIFTPATKPLSDTKSELLTSDKWLEKIGNGMMILDPDGWDRKNYKYSFYEELITEQEFNHRLMQSTITRKQPLSDKQKQVLEEAVTKTVKQYGKTLEMLADEDTKTLDELIDEILKESWRQGYYTNNNTATTHFTLATNQIKELIAEQVRLARVEALQWALNDYNMSDTDTRANLEGYIKELQEGNN